MTSWADKCGGTTTDGFTNVGKRGKAVKPAIDTSAHNQLIGERKEMKEHIDIINEQLQNIENQILFFKATEGKCENPECSEYPLYFGFHNSVCKCDKINTVELEQFNNKGWFKSAFCSTECSKKHKKKDSCVFCIINKKQPDMMYCSEVCQCLGQVCRKCSVDINTPDANGIVTSYQFCKSCLNDHLELKSEQKDLNMRKKIISADIRSINFKLNEIKLDKPFESDFKPVSSDNTSKSDSKKDSSLVSANGEVHTSQDVCTSPIHCDEKEKGSSSNTSINKHTSEDAVAVILNILEKTSSKSKTYMALLKELEKVTKEQ